MEGAGQSAIVMDARARGERARIGAGGKARRAIDPRGAERRSASRKQTKQIGGRVGRATGSQARRAGGDRRTYSAWISPSWGVASPRPTSRRRTSGPRASRGVTLRRREGAPPTLLLGAPGSSTERFPKRGRAGERLGISRARDRRRVCRCAQSVPRVVRVSRSTLFVGARARVRSTAARPTWIFLQCSCSARRPRANQTRGVITSRF